MNTSMFTKLTLVALLCVVAQPVQAGFLTEYLVKKPATATAPAAPANNAVVEAATKDASVEQSTPASESTVVEPTNYVGPVVEAVAEFASEGVNGLVDMGRVAVVPGSLTGAAVRYGPAVAVAATYGGLRYAGYTDSFDNAVSYAVPSSTSGRLAAGTTALATGYAFRTGDWKTSAYVSGAAVLGYGLTYAPTVVNWAMNRFGRGETSAIEAAKAKPSYKALVAILDEAKTKKTVVKGTQSKLEAIFTEEAKSQDAVLAEVLPTVTEFFNAIQAKSETKVNELYTAITAKLS